MKLLKRLSPALIVVVVISLSACGGSTDATVAEQAGASSPEVAGEQVPAVMESEIPGGRKAAYESCTFFLPRDWKGDGDTGLWSPGDRNLNMGRPGVSLHCGGIPVMSGNTVDDRLKFYYGVVPTTVKKFRKFGMNARYVDVTAHGKRHLGLILEEKTGPMMILNFFDCQAPEGEFGTHQGTFKKILKSVNCRK